MLFVELMAAFFDASKTRVLNTWRVLNLFEMLLLIGWVMYDTNKNKSYYSQLANQLSILIIVGFVFSFMGGVINNHLIDLTFILKNQSILSAIPFSIAHILYIRSYYLLSQNPQNTTNYFITDMKRLRIISLIVWPIFVFALWKILIPSTAPVVIKYICLGYAFMVSLMALTSFWVYNAWGSRGIMVTIGGIIFLVSDCVFGYFLMQGPNVPILAAHFVWITYYIAQLCIAQTPFVPSTSKKCL